jgi:GT2 family glycosyltransferase
MRMAEKLTVVIPTHNRRDILRATLRRLDPPVADVRVLVFCDACTDGTEAMVRAEFPWVRLISSSDKLGHSVARSCAFAACETEFILSIDDDSWPMDADYAGRIFAAFARWPRAAFLASSVHDDRHPEGAAAVGEEPYRVRNFVGCGFAVRTKVFAELGGFRQFFQYGGEELEIALRAHAQGWEIVFLPALRIYHDRTSVNRDEYEMIRSGFGNNLSACLLNEPAWICGLHLIRLSWKGFLHAIKRGYPKAPLVAWKEFLGRFPTLLKARKPLSSSAVLSWHRLKSCPPA